jgi:RNA polymerase-binding transcription factor DksA
MNQQELQERQKELIAKRDELQERLNAIQKDIGRGLDKDWEEQAVQLENAEVLDEIARVTSEELHKIEQGIERIEKALSQM